MKGVIVLHSLAYMFNGGARPIAFSPVVTLPIDTGHICISRPKSKSHRLKSHTVQLLNAHCLFLSYRERLCAFCYCGDRSLLGQGDLQVFTFTPQLQALSSGKDGEDSTSDSGDNQKTTHAVLAEETTSEQREKTK